MPPAGLQLAVNNELCPAHILTVDGVILKVPGCAVTITVAVSEHPVELVQIKL